MIPTHIIRLEALPRTQSGKLSRKLLPKPELTADPAQYEAPANNVERALCDAMAAVLALDRVSASEDFFHIGGSSIKSIALIGRCELPGLNAGQIFRGRTPRKIAALYLAERSHDDEEMTLSERNRAAMRRAYPLTAEQRYMLDYLLYSPKSTMQNLYDFMRIDGDIDADRFAQAVNATVRSHPALMTILAFNVDSELIQRYAPETFAPVAVEHITEAELDAMKATLIQPFALIGRSQSKFRLFQTEKALYFFQDVNHLFTDGASMELFNREVVERYAKDGDIAPGEPDNYYLMLSERTAYQYSQRYVEDRDYYDKRYGGIAWSKRLNTELNNRGNELGYLERFMEVSQASLELLMQNSTLGKSGLFIVSELLALAAYNQTADVMVTWIYNGRDDVNSQSIVGLLFRELPVAVSVDAHMTLQALCAEVQDQIVQGIVHSAYPWVSLDANPQRNDNTSVNYQNMIGMEKELPIEVESIELPEPCEASPTALDIDILDVEGGICAEALFSASRFKESDVERFLNLNIAFFNAMLEQRETLDITLEALFKGMNLDFPCL